MNKYKNCFNIYKKIIYQEIRFLRMNVKDIDMGGGRNSGIILNSISYKSLFYIKSPEFGKYSISNLLIINIFFTKLFLQELFLFINKYFDHKIHKTWNG
jgi:hypothetical protein